MMTAHCLTFQDWMVTLPCHAKDCNYLCLLKLRKGPKSHVRASSRFNLLRPRTNSLRHDQVISALLYNRRGMRLASHALVGRLFVQHVLRRRETRYFNHKK